jgi:NAD(P)H-nitrite reductase large subunit
VTVDVVVIGSGIGGFSFADEFRKLNPEARITLVTQESAGYYSRPLLSHGFTREDIETRIVMRRFEDIESSGIHVLSNCEAMSIDRETRTVKVRHNGEATALPYDRLVLAQGSAALIPPPFVPYASLFKVLNSYSDLTELRRLRSEFLAAGPKPRWAIVGGGLIGCELASDLATAGDDVTLFHALPRLMERQLVEEDSAMLLKLLTEAQGVTVKLNENVQSFGGTAGQLTVKTAEGDYPGYQTIVIACGFKPRIDLAKSAGIATGRGIRVNGLLATDDPNIHAIGDVAECADGRIYAYVTPIRSQAIWLAQFLAGKTETPWEAPAFKPKAKVHGFTAAHPYLF